MTKIPMIDTCKIEERQLYGEDKYWFCTFTLLDNPNTYSMTIDFRQNRWIADRIFLFNNEKRIELSIDERFQVQDHIAEQLYTLIAEKSKNTIRLLLGVYKKSYYFPHTFKVASYDTPREVEYVVIPVE